MYDFSEAVFQEALLNALWDEGLLELNGKTYMLSLKVYETVKTDVAYVQDTVPLGQNVRCNG